MLDRDSGNRLLIYTSAGDHANLDHWMRGRSGFDLWVTYYGNGTSPWDGIADFHEYRSGGKFPNLLQAYLLYPEVFRRYAFIGVFDDDLVIPGRDIARVASIMESRGLVLAQPAFHPRGRISHEITRARPWSLFRQTSFVEVTCPVFRTPVLLRFLEVYDPALVGWGVDHWFSHFVREEGSGPLGIIDAVTCRNPWEAEKGGSREIDLLQEKEVRKATWERIRAERKIPEVPPASLPPIRAGLGFKDLVRSANLVRFHYGRRLARRLSRILGKE